MERKKFLIKFLLIRSFSVKMLLYKANGQTHKITVFSTLTYPFGSRVPSFSSAHLVVFFIPVFVLPVPPVLQKLVC
jgi:hypothetical protein